ncbi:MAG: SpoIIE family protein phosphatase, partial [Flavobacteriales bacterium]
GLFSIAGKKFEETQIQLEENDQLFLFSDGYTDQIGGPRKKRFMSKRLKETIKELLSSSSSDQHKKLIETIIDWKGNNEEQLDDILVLGIKL